MLRNPKSHTSYTRLALCLLRTVSSNILFSFLDNITTNRSLRLVTYLLDVCHIINTRYLCVSPFIIFCLLQLEIHYHFTLMTSFQCSNQHCGLFVEINKNVDRITLLCFYRLEQLHLCLSRFHQVPLRLNCQIRHTVMSFPENSSFESKINWPNMAAMFVCLQYSAVTLYNRALPLIDTGQGFLVYD